MPQTPELRKLHPTTVTIAVNVSDYERLLQKINHVLYYDVDAFQNGRYVRLQTLARHAPVTNNTLELGLPAISPFYDIDFSDLQTPVDLSEIPLRSSIQLSVTSYVYLINDGQKHVTGEHQGMFDVRSTGANVVKLPDLPRLLSILNVKKFDEHYEVTLDYTRSDNDQYISDRRYRVQLYDANSAMLGALDDWAVSAVSSSSRAIVKVPVQIGEERSVAYVVLDTLYVFTEQVASVLNTNRITLTDVKSYSPAA